MLFVLGIVLASLVHGAYSEALNSSNYDSCVPRTNGVVCYSAVDTFDLWEVGDRICRARNMTMLEILTEDENKAVLDLLTKKGMVDSWLAAMQSMDSWRWLDDVVLGDQGCFLDNDTSPDMVYSKDFPSNNSVTNCIEHCRRLSYSYASVESGIRCHCGDSFGKYGQENSNCGIQCPGNTNQSCGGDRPLSQQIYAVNGAPANWLGGQPNNNNGYQSCATIDSFTQFKWQDVFCRDGYKAICEIPLFANNSCSNSRAALVNGRCLIMTDIEVNYFKSRYTCRSFGGDLVMHVTPTDTQAISTWLRLPPNSTIQFFIGLVKWQWQWQTGREFLYTNWKYDQPTGPNLNCITIKQGSATGEWMASSCDVNHLYICQKSNATAVVTAPLFTMAPTTTAKRTAPPPLPTTSTRATSLRSSMGQSQQPSDRTPSSNSTTHSVNAAIIGGAVAGGVLLLIVICVVVVIIAVFGAPCCSRRKEVTKEKNGISGTEPAAVIPSPPSYFFGIDTTPKYRSGEQIYPSIPDFGVKKAGTTFSRRPKSLAPDVIPGHSYPMATPFNDTMATRAKPNPYSTDIYVNAELSY